MASSSSILSKLIFEITANSAALKQGLADANSSINAFKDKIGKIGDIISGAFTVTAIIGFSKELFNIATEMDDLGGKVEDLGFGINQALDGAKVKAIAEAFNTDFDSVLGAGAAVARNFGITLGDALQYIQNGLTLAGPQSEKFLKSIRDQSASYANLQGDASTFFSVVTEGYRYQTNFEEQLKQGRKAQAQDWKDIVAQENEGQRIQQDLIEASTRWNTVLIKLFDGSNDRVDKLKAGLYNIGTELLLKIANGVITSTNYFITLYNESLGFRLIIIGLINDVKFLWEGFKLVANVVYEILSSSARLIKDIFTGHVRDIPLAYEDAFKNIGTDFVDFGKNVYSDIKDGVEMMVNKEPIKLLNLADVERQAEQATRVVRQVTQPLKLTFFKDDQQDEKPFSMLTPGVATAGAGEGKVVSVVQGQMTQVKQLINVWKQFGKEANIVLQQQLVAGIEGVGNALGNLIAGSKSGFKDLIGSMLDGIKKVLEALLAQAIAGMIAGESQKGLVGLITATVGIAALESLWRSKVPAFASGTDYAPGGLSLVGEHGPEIQYVPRGASVFTNSNTNRILGGLGGGNNIHVTIESRIMGTDIYQSVKEVERRRNNTN